MSGISPIGSAMASQVASAYRMSTRQSGGAWTAPKAAAPATFSPGPAATVQISGTPASVDADDKAIYSQMLAMSHNAGAAMAAVKSSESGEKDG